MAPGESVILCSHAVLQLTGSGPEIPGHGQHLGALAMLHRIHQRACDTCTCTLCSVLVLIQEHTDFLVTMGPDKHALYAL